MDIKLASSYIEMANLLAKQSKCAKTEVGALIVKEGRIISSGVNGTPSGYTNCNDKFDYRCKMEEYPQYEEHREWSSIHEIHAEVNALSRAGSIESLKGNFYLIVNKKPCLQCQKMIALYHPKAVYYYDEKESIEEDSILFSQGIGAVNLAVNTSTKTKPISREDLKQLASNVEIGLRNLYSTDMNDGESFTMVIKDVYNKILELENKEESLSPLSPKEETKSYLVDRDYYLKKYPIGTRLRYKVKDSYWYPEEYTYEVGWDSISNYGVLDETGHCVYEGRMVDYRGYRDAERFIESDWEVVYDPNKDDDIEDDLYFLTGGNRALFNPIPSKYRV